MIIRWLTRHSWKILKWFLTGTALYLLAGILCSLIPLQGEKPKSIGVQVFVVSNGVHTDICLPIRNNIQDWRDLFPLEEEFPGRTVRYLCFGWGDLNFYVNTPSWADLKVRTSLKAIFWPSETALHVTPWSNEPEVHTRCRRLFLSEDRYRKLCDFIEAHLLLESTGGAHRIRRGFGGGDAFYQSKGSYHLLRTCNEWTSEALHVAGVQTAIWAPFAQSVMMHLP